MTFKAVLLVDAGNTAVKSAWLSASGATGTATGDALLQPASIANAQASPQALCALWSEISTPSGVRPQDTALSWLSVGPAQVAESIRKAYSDWAGRPAPQPHVATAEHMLFQSSCRVRNAYEQPAQLGADRWACAIGAAHLLRDAPAGNYLIVSAGTATTLDLLTVSRQAHETQIEFSGGWILPGLTMMQEGLRHGTAGLRYEPKIDALSLKQPPRNSALAIGQGIALAQTGYVSALVQQLSVREVWLHGGSAQQWKSCLQATGQDSVLSRLVMQPGLSLRGLACLAL